jgi:hypothetical protein
LQNGTDAEFAVSYALEWRDALLGELYLTERKYRCILLLQKQEAQKAHEEVLGARQRVLSSFKGLSNIISQVRETGLTCDIEPLVEGRQMPDNIDVLPKELVFVYSDKRTYCDGRFVRLAYDHLKPSTPAWRLELDEPLLNDPNRCTSLYLHARPLLFISFACSSLFPLFMW